MVYSLCLGYVQGDTDQADDLTQEVFIKVWGALAKFKGNSSPKTWIYRICVNTCLVHLRDNKKKHFQSLKENYQELAEEKPVNDPFQYLYDAIGKLQELDRIIILLVLEEVKYTEIASITGITEGNLRVKISRIKQKLNSLITE